MSYVDCLDNNHITRDCRGVLALAFKFTSPLAPSNIALVTRNPREKNKCRFSMTKTMRLCQVKTKGCYDVLLQEDFVV